MFYTYIHMTADTGRVFYVGKGADRRIHRKDARNQHWKNVVAKHGYVAHKLADWPTEKEAFEHEKFLIWCYKSMGVKLVNQSGGGDGNDASGGFSFKGRKHSDSAKLKCRLANLGKIVSEEAKQKLREKKRKAIKINGVVYESVQQACEATGIPVGSIGWLLNKTSPTVKWSNFVVEKVL